MSYVIQITGFASGAPCPIAGEFVKSFDFDALDGLGEGEFTRKRSEAMVFGSRAEALEFWRRQSTKHPARADGKPNRPLTCSNVVIWRVLHG